MNQLYYGDNLKVLQSSIEDESIDLIYIDPPFNSKRAYNVLFESIDLTDVKAQKEAFKDTWSNVIYLDEMNQIQNLDLGLYNFLKTLDGLPLSKGAVSYLTIMAHRIWYMHKKLKDTGSFYLHCDPTMSHYLKIVCDLIFGHRHFRNEIVWCYSRMAARGQRQLSRCHDTVLWYSKGDKWIFNVDEIRLPYAETSIAREGYKKTNLGGGSPKSNICELNEKGKFPEDWIQIPFIRGEEYIGYATQKPEALLERIVKASSKRGQVVADFFCGCGTTITVAQKLGRKWIGVDISHLAVRLVYDRVLKPFEGKPKAYNKILNSIEINGFPKDIASAKDLAQKTDKHRLQFQDWVVEFMMNGVRNPKRSGDSGYDGYITFGKSDKEKGVILIEVKSGKAGVEKIRSFIETVNKMNAAFGAFVCFAEEVTEPMRKWAKQAGYFDAEVWGNKFDRIQIVTVEDLLAGKSVQFPVFQNITFKTATNIPIKNENNNHSLFE